MYVITRVIKITRSLNEKTVYEVEPTDIDGVTISHITETQSYPTLGDFVLIGRKDGVVPTIYHIINNGKYKEVIK